MLEKLPFPTEHIIHCLNVNYGIEVITLSLLPLGADTNALLYKAQAQDQSFYFIKLKHGQQLDISVVVIELLHKAGLEQVILPVKTMHGQATQHIENYTLVVYPFMEGQNGFSRTLTDEQWLTLGKVLRKIHACAVPVSIQQQIRRETYSPQWRTMVRLLYQQIETNVVEDEIALQLQNFMQENKLAIQQLVNRAEQLAQILQQQAPQFVLCHSDIHAGNILIGNNHAIYIVDWDDPIMAPKERDLMFIGGGVGNVWNQLHEAEIFYKGYGKTAIDTRILTYYRHERIVEDIAIYGQDLLLTTAGGENRLTLYQQFIAMFEPNGVVDIAFKTYS